MCTWEGFYDEESPIVNFYLMVGTRAGSSDVLDPVEQPNTASSYAIEGDYCRNKYANTAW